MCDIAIKKFFSWPTLLTNVFIGTFLQMIKIWENSNMFYMLLVQDKAIKQDLFSLNNWRQHGWKNKKWGKVTAARELRMKSMWWLWPPPCRQTPSWISLMSSMHIQKFRLPCCFWFIKFLFMIPLGNWTFLFRAIVVNYCNSDRAQKDMNSIFSIMN